MSRAAYPAEHDLRVGSLYVWKGNLKRRGLFGSDHCDVGFDPVMVVPEPGAPMTSCTVHFSNGCVMEVMGVAGLGGLVSVITAVASLS